MSKQFFSNTKTKSVIFTETLVKMLRYFAYITFLMVLILSVSCRKDFEFTLSSGQLQFSKDTVYLDTVFTRIGSSTYSLKVYNRSSDDIYIPKVGLGRGQNSYYRLSVDGMAGQEFENVEILAKDSLFIFVETTLDIQDHVTGALEFLYTDAIEFTSGNTLQEVALVTLVKDAVFLYPQEFDDGTSETLLLGLDDNGEEIRIEGFYLEDNELIFTNEKPYVIYGYAAVKPGKTLTVQAGARIHFHNNSGIIVADGSSLHINGALSTDPELLENEVVFEGDRLEPGFSDTPGQWGTVWLTAGSMGHFINYLTIKNASVGILMDSNDGSGNPTLTIKNTQIYNSASVGLWGKTAHIEAENLVVGNTGQIGVYCNIGGSYNFKHCTIANYWTKGFRNTPTLLIDNYVDLGQDGIFTQPLTQATFSNCIIDGNTNIEMFLDPADGIGFTYEFKNSLIRFNDTSNRFADNPLFDFNNNVLYNQIILNGDADFKDVSANQFLVGENTAGKARADLNDALLVPEDILGVDRTIAPDLGAYQHMVFPTN